MSDPIGISFDHFPNFFKKGGLCIIFVFFWVVVRVVIHSMTYINFKPKKMVMPLYSRYASLIRRGPRHIPGEYSGMPKPPNGRNSFIKWLRVWGMFQGLSNYPFWGYQSMQMYGNFGGFAWVGNLIYVGQILD